MTEAPIRELHMQGTSPLSSLKYQFENRAEYWGRRIGHVLGIMNELEQRLDPQATRSDTGVTQAREKLTAAVDEVLQRAAKPELVLAMTGTTSSAKSTLANFLIGEKLLPSAVQEMSAGVVIVRHHATRRRLRVSATHGAAWESEEWDHDQGADGVRRRLGELMAAFRVAEKVDPTIEPIRFEIDWPIRMILEAGTFGLPDETELTILDLPGLNSATDERNRAVIADNIGQALCLVAYDCGETDGRKQELLLNQVVQQVMALRTERSSVDRMLFLLNKADVFLKDEDPDRSLGAFRTRVTIQLREKLLKELKENREQIEQIEPIELSPEAALWAIVAARDEAAEAGIKHLEKIERNYAFLFPPHYWKDWPRDLAKATVEQRRRLIDDTLYYARADGFERRLREHIAEKLPDIILAGSIAAVKEAESELLTRLDQFIEARIIRTEEEAKEKCAHLASISTHLRSEEEHIKDDFKVLRDITLEEESTWTYSLGKLEYLEEKIGNSDLLKPIEDLGSDITVRPFADLQDYCISSLENRNPIPSPLMIGAPNLVQLDEKLGHLRKTRYREFAESGGRIEDGNDALVVRAALAALVEQLSTTCNFMIEAVIGLSGARIEWAFQGLADGLLRRANNYGLTKLEEGLLNSFPGLATIFAGNVKLEPFKISKIPKFAINIGSWHEDKITSERVIRYERSFWTLYLWRHEIEDTTEVTRRISGIELLGLGKLIDPEQFKEMLLGPLKDYIGDCIKKVEFHIEQRLKHAIGGYDSAIAQSRQQISICADQETAILMNTKRAIEGLMSNAETIPEDGLLKERQRKLEQNVA